MQIKRRALLTGIGYGALARSQGIPARDLSMLSLAEARKLMQSGRVSPVELVDACYGRIVRLNPKLNAYITVDINAARNQARRLERLPPDRRGILHGIPIGIKDNVDTAGLRTSAASRVLARNMPSRDADVVRRLKSAGAIVIGKHNLHEFAHGTTSAISAFGAVHNPWHLDYTAGGSSGGSAAAVAAGMCYGAIGTDTGGSVRIPASCCGVVGLKPTLGLVSTAGVIPEVQSMDCVGPICRSVEDAAYMLAAMAPGQDGVVRDLTAPVIRLRVGVLQNYMSKADESVRQSVETALDVVQRLTASVRPISVPEVPKSINFVFGAENYRNHRDWLRRRVGLYQPETRDDLLKSAPITPAQYQEGLSRLQALRLEISRTFEDIDIVVLPTLRTEPLALSRCKAPFDLDPEFTGIFNIFGLPAISVPCGIAPSGLPIGIQIAGPAGHEETLLALAHRFQQATDWHRRRSPIAE